MIVGTAGHIDHGKSTLVRALTGVDTDRLPEEKKRGIYDDLYLRGYRDAYPKYWRYLFDENDSSYGDSDVAEIIEEARSVWMKRK